MLKGKPKGKLQGGLRGVHLKGTRQKLRERVPERGS